MCWVSKYVYIYKGGLLGYTYIFIHIYLIKKIFDSVTRLNYLVRETNILDTQIGKVVCLYVEK